MTQLIGLLWFFAPLIVLLVGLWVGARLKRTTDAAGSVVVVVPAEA